MSPMQKLKNYMSVPGKPVTNAELIEFKNTDQAGYEQVRDGIDNGSFTY